MRGKKYWVRYKVKQNIKIHEYNIISKYNNSFINKYFF